MQRLQLERYGGLNIPPQQVDAACDYCLGVVMSIPVNSFVGYLPATSGVNGNIPPSYGFSLPSGWLEGVGDWVLNAAGQWVKKKLAGGATTSGSPIPGGGTFVDPTKCPDGQIGIPPACFDLMPGGDTSGGGMYIGYGEAVMGRFGAAIQPAVRPLQVRRCPRGAVLGVDNLCYNSRDLRKSDRKWVPGRRPLLTGGDLNAIARASRAAGKMKTQQKRLQKLGLLPKPKAQRGRKGTQMVLPSSVPGVQLISND